VQKQQILEQFPLLNDKRHLSWTGDPGEVVRELRSRLGVVEGGSSQHRATPDPGHGLPPRVPKIRKQFTQRDRDLFLRNAFTVVRQHFRDGLEALSREYGEVDTDFADVHSFKFVCTVYVRGEVGERCKIWLGGLMSTDSIAYSSGPFTIDRDNSLNDWLAVDDDERELGLRPSGMWLGRGEDHAEGKLLSPEQAGEYLWDRFTESLS
jgi:hypothetical protein